MSKQIKARSIRHPDSSIGAREIALAGLGAASLARKQAIKSFSELYAIADRLPEASAIFLEGIGERAQALKDAVVTNSSSLRNRVDQLARIASVEVEHRIAPLLAAFGVQRKATRRKPLKARRGVKAKTRKGAAKRTTRKAA
jgi:hypothetical protein